MKSRNRSPQILLFIILVAIILYNGQVFAAYLGFTFDANQFIQTHATDYTTGLKATQNNPRRVHSSWASSFYQTFSDSLASGTVQPNSGNTYANWAEGLGSGEGITAFNIWLLDNPAARSWGESLVTEPDGIKPVGYAPTGWNSETIANPWGSGWLVQWWTEDISYAINSNSTLGQFAFNADVYVDNDQNAWDNDDPDASLGNNYRIWFGSYWGALPDDWDSADHSLAFDDTGWDTNSPNYGTFKPTAGPDGSNVGWEGVLTIEASNPVPIPGAVWLLGSGLLGMIGIRRRRAQGASAVA